MKFSVAFVAAIALCLVAGAAAEGKPRKLEGDEVEAQHSGTYTYNGCYKDMAPDTDKLGASDWKCSGTREGGWKSPYKVNSTCVAQCDNSDGNITVTCLPIATKVWGYTYNPSWSAPVGSCPKNCKKGGARWWVKCGSNWEWKDGDDMGYWYCGTKGNYKWSVAPGVNCTYVCKNNQNVTITATCNGTTGTFDKTGGPCPESPKCAALPDETATKATWDKWDCDTSARKRDVPPFSNGDKCWGDCKNSWKTLKATCKNGVWDFKGKTC